jgi:hypothetical protein
MPRRADVARSNPRHEALHRILKRLPSDFEPWGGRPRREDWGPDCNSRWAEVTRPILEAFLHAPVFLEMAVRYANLGEPPTPLPIGYAALLHLFGLR